MTNGKQKRPRHCMIVHAYYPLRETRVQREAEALLRYGYEVDVICLREKGEPARDHFKGVAVYRMPVGRHEGIGVLAQLFEYLSFFFMAMFTVAWLYLRRRYATVQVHNLPDFLVFSAWFPRLFGAKIILDLHDLMPEFYMSRFQRGADSLPVRLVRLQERLSCWFAHHVITVSHHWQQTLSKRSAPLDKISVVMNVADDTIFRPDLSRQQPQDGEGLHLIYHGTVTQRYGLDLVVRAMHQLRDTAPNVHLTILGGGDHRPTVARLAEELGLEDRVTFMRKYRPAEELPAVILTADAGVVPYRDDPFTDGLVPTKLLEYAALGMPSIAARTTAIASYFDDTMVEFFKPGNVDDLARCISTLYFDKERRAQLAQGTARFRQKYNWTDISAEYAALLDRLGGHIVLTKY